MVFFLSLSPLTSFATSINMIEGIRKDNLSEHQSMPMCLFPYSIAVWCHIPGESLVLALSCRPVFWKVTASLVDVVISWKPAHFPLEHDFRKRRAPHFCLCSYLGLPYSSIFEGGVHISTVFPLRRGCLMISPTQCKVWELTRPRLRFSSLLMEILQFLITHVPALCLQFIPMLTFAQSGFQCCEEILLVGSKDLGILWKQELFSHMAPAVEFQGLFRVLLPRNK